MLSSNGSQGTCIPRGLTTFLQGAFTAHLIDLVEQRRDQIHCGHGLLRSSLSFTLSTSLEEVHAHDKKASKDYYIYWFVRD